MNILGNTDTDNLQTFIDKPVFVNSESEKPMSLMNAAMGRYSDIILSQVYSFEANLPQKEDSVKTLSKREKSKLKKQQKKITFRKNEIFFKN